MYNHCHDQTYIWCKFCKFHALHELEKKGKTTTINIHPKKHVITQKHKGKLTSALQVWNVQYVALQMEYSVK